ncbi:MAG TPA: DegV family protein [Clostridia bacterium]|nr:DegV family protein [Clostridia bacterium]
MGTVRVISDSTCDLSSELIERHGIAIVPLYVVFGEKSYRDGIDISTEELYGKVEETNTLPKTSAPSPLDFQRIFKKYTDNGEDIIYIGLSSGISVTLQNAAIAAQEFPEGKIEIVDSQNLSTGIGLLVMKAVDYAGDGMNVREIAAKIRELAPRVRTRFIINTLDYLHKGGRCTALESFIGGLLNIRPVVSVRDGKMFLEDKIRGRREKARSNMLENVLADKDSIMRERVFITHSMDSEEAELLKGILQKEIKGAEIIVTDAGCVISSHCGPKTVGVLYIRK